jgi:hypothetical protein
VLLLPDLLPSFVPTSIESSIPNNATLDISTLRPMGFTCVDHNEVISAAGTSTTKLSLDELHRRMGHIAPDAAQKLVKDGLVSGIELKGKGDTGLCDSCKYAKATKKGDQKERAEPRAQNFGDEIHSNVWGPSQTKTICKCKYYILFTDDSTCYACVELL